MTNKNISGLTAATTPLAGTELVPVWDGAGTKKVTVANLTAGRDVLMAGLTATGNVTLGDAATDTLNVGAGGFVKNSSGNVGVGVSAPAYRFDVRDINRTGNSVNVAVLTTDAVAAGVGGSLGLGGQWAAGNYTSYAAIRGLKTNATSGNYSGYLTLETTPVSGGALTERVRIDSSGNATITNGNLIQGTAAKGINFTANTPAAGMTSQLLNWYEEGTFTPALTFGGGSTGIIYTTRTGYYERIGNQVNIRIYIELSNKGSSTGIAEVNGLPFTANASYAPTLVWASSVSSTGTVQAIVKLSSTTIRLHQINTTGTVNTLTSVNFSNISSFMLGATYRVA